MTCVFEWMNVYFSLFRAIGSLDWSTLLGHLSLFFCRFFSLYFCQSSCVSCLLHNGSLAVVMPSLALMMILSRWLMMMVVALVLCRRNRTTFISSSSRSYPFFLFFCLLCWYYYFNPSDLLFIISLPIQSTPFISTTSHFPFFCTLASYNVIIAF